MNRRCKVFVVAGGFGVIAAVVLGIGPFLVPVLPLEATAPPEKLADADSRFIEIGSLTVHYKMAGEDQPVLVLLHGFLASTFSWREVMGPLAEGGTAISFDRPAFGLTERPMPGTWSGRSPYDPEAQADLTVSLLDALAVDQAVLVGHSAGGPIAVLTALRYPERVKALVLVAPALHTGGMISHWITAILRTPQMRRLGPLFMRSVERWGADLGRAAWHDPSRLTPELWEGYRKPLRAENWDRALWEFVLASRPLDLEKRLTEIQVPVLVITGDDDRVVPTEQSVRLADEVPGAQLVVLSNCGHVPQEECPEAFLDGLNGFLAELER